jgi:hypothetical protein
VNHAEAIVDAVEAAVPAGVAVFDAIIGGVPPARYVVLYIPDVLRQMSSIDPVSDGLSCDFQVTTVASNAIPAYAAAECRWLSMAVNNALVDLVITPTGMSPARIVQEGAQSPRPDEATPDKKVYATAQFSFRSVQV